MANHSERGLRMVTDTRTGLTWLHGEYGTMKQVFFRRFQSLDADYLADVDRRWTRIGKLVSG